MATDLEIQDARISQAAQAIPGTAIESVPYLDFRLVTAITKFTPDVFYGSYAGLAGPVEVALPFDPAQVQLINETTLATYDHLPSMAAATAFQRVTAGTLSLVGAAGVTLGAKGERKFTADTGVHGAADVVHFIAYGTRGVGGSA